MSVRWRGGWRDHLWDAGVGANGSLPGSSARKGRSLAVDHPCAGRTFPGGQARHAEERLREAAAILR
jgi:hypothetical protein